MQARPFIYNPSQDIQKAGKDVSGGIEQAFAREIQNREQFFNTTTKFIENIESYKKNLNQFNYKAISEKADQLIKDVAGSIKSKGKIDSDALFGLREKMTEIRNAKEQSDMIPKIIEENVKRARDKGSYIRDPQKYYNELLQLAENKDLLFSATTFESAANKLYSKNLDYGRIVNDKLKVYADANFSKDKSGRGLFSDEKGGQFESSIKVNPFFDVDARGEQVPKLVPLEGGGSREAYKGVLESILSPEEIEGFKENIVGSGMAFDGNVSERLNDISRDFFEAYSGFDKKYKQTPEQVTSVKLGNTKKQQEVDAFAENQKMKREAHQLRKDQFAFLKEKWSYMQKQDKLEWLEKGFMDDGKGGVTYDEAKDIEKQRRAVSGQGDMMNPTGGGAVGKVNVGGFFKQD